MFYDAGIGVARCVRSVQTELPTDSSAIEWALEKGTSTLLSADEPRGLGLYLLREFIRANGGEFHIYANHGVVAEKGGKRERGKLRHPLFGTLIDMRIKIRSDVKYSFTQ